MMDDAYVIGIRLALEDGVSAGVASIAADLTMLDRAIASTEAGLARLQRIAGAVSGVASVSLLQREVTASSDIAAPPATEGGLAVPSPVPRVTAVGGVSAQNAPLAPNSVERPIGVPARLVLPDPIAPIVHVAAAEPIVQVIREFAGFAPSVAVSGPAQPMGATNMPAVKTRDVPDTRVQADAPIIAPTLAATGRAVAPVMQMARDTPPPSALAGVALDHAAAAPARAMAPAQVTQGDVYLDGARMGRWMADTLARAASRPMGGMTGFDGRMGPAWPGSLQGG
jgi:hypothetical protein